MYIWPTGIYRKRCSILLMTSEIQIKTALRYYLKPVRMTHIIAWKQPVLVRLWKGSSHHCWWTCYLVQRLWKSIWRSLQKIELELPYGPFTFTFTFLGIYPQNKTLIWKSMYTVRCSSYYNKQDMETTQLSNNYIWADQEVVVGLEQ